MLCKADYLILFRPEKSSEKETLSNVYTAINCCTYIALSCLSKPNEKQSIYLKYLSSGERYYETMHKKLLISVKIL